MWRNSAVDAERAPLAAHQRPTLQDTGLPRLVSRFKMLQPRTASVCRPPVDHVLSLGPMIDLYRNITVATQGSTCLLFRAAVPFLLFREHRLKACLGICHHRHPALSVEAARTVRVDWEIRVQLGVCLPPMIVQEEIGEQCQVEVRGDRVGE